MIILYFMPIIILDLMYGFLCWINRKESSDFEVWTVAHLFLLLSVFIIFAFVCAGIGIIELLCC